MCSTTLGVYGNPNPVQVKCLTSWCVLSLISCLLDFINITLLLIKITLAIFASQFTDKTDAKLNHFITRSSESVRGPSAVIWLPEGWKRWHFRETLSRGDMGKDTQRHGHLMLVLNNHISKIWPKSPSWFSSSGTYYSRNCHGWLALALKGLSENLGHEWK